ncbi:MAG: mechanosensitive ion channel domain-containing protein [Planctomycetota bacterium]|jgi:potassium efflux system protein
MIRLPSSCPLVSPSVRLLAVLALVASAAGQVADAAPPSPPPPVAADPVELNRSAIEAARAELAAIAEPTDATTRAIALYDEALATLARAAEWTTRAADFERERLAASVELEAITAELSQAPETMPEVPEGATINELEQQLNQAQAGLDAAIAEITALEQERIRRGERLAAIPAEIETQRSAIEQIGVSQLAPPPAEEAPEVTEARRVELAARRREAEARLDALQKELANLEARSSLLPLRIERWNARRAAREQRLAAWREVVSEQRRTIAARDAAAAREARARAVPALAPVADRVVALTEGRSAVLAQKSATEQELATLRDELTTLLAREQLLRQRVRTGQTSVAGVRLRRERATLPNLADHTRRVRDRRGLIADTYSTLADLELEVGLLPPKSEQLEAILATVDPGLSAAMRAEVEADVDTLLTNLRVTIRATTEDHNELLEGLIEAQTLQRGLIAATEGFRDFIDEHILWIRSAPPLGIGDLRPAGSSLLRLVSADLWRTVARDLWLDLRVRPWLDALSVLTIGLLLASRRWLRLQLRHLAERVGRFTEDRMALTGRALLVTLGLTLVGPLIVWFLAWQLQGGESEQSAAVAAGLRRVGRALLTLELIRQLCRPHGLADAHFRWRPQTRAVLTRVMRVLVPIVLPIVFMVQAQRVLTDESGDDPLARLAFMVGMVAIAWAMFLILHPRRGVVEGYLSGHRGGWLDRLSPVWHPIFAALPLVLAVAASLGYQYTATQMFARILETSWVILGAVVAQGLMFRWLLLVRRRMAMDEARRRREAAQAKAEEGGGDVPVVEDDLALDVVTIDTQARRLVRVLVTIALAVGIWVVWVQWLPALRALDRVQVWPSFAVLAEQEEVLVSASLLTPGGAGGAAGEAGEAAATEGGEATAGDPAAAAAPENGPALSLPGLPAGGPEAAPAAGGGRSLTLADIFSAIIIIVVTVLVSRNLPGILEITVLSRLPLTRSGRYATTTVFRYAVTIVGIVLAFNAIGIGWSNVQWLAAAITVGLGFGLQEIFANFVSGLILLFEQPIRVGDTVTVGEMNGTVSQIRMRATTIIDWDRKELVIPNKEFVTGKITNWSLSNKILRVIVPVGIAYGSDTDLARRTLLDVARAAPRVLEDPGPQAFFLGFGDSSLDFQLRIFIDDIDHFSVTRAELYHAIDDAFRAAGIEIAFPQRDIHVRSIKAPLMTMVERVDEAETAETAETTAERGTAPTREA